MTGKSISTNIADVWLSEGVIWVQVNNTEAHNVEDAHQLIDAVNTLADGRCFPVLADIRSIRVGADKEARNYYVTHEATQYLSAFGFLTNSAFQRTVGALYFYLSRPPYPCKLFKKEVAARQWLQNHSFTS